MHVICDQLLFLNIQRKPNKRIPEHRPNRTSSPTIKIIFQSIAKNNNKINKHRINKTLVDKESIMQYPNAISISKITIVYFSELHS